MADSKAKQSQKSVTLKSEKAVYTVFKKDGTTVSVEATSTAEAIKQAEAEE